GTVQLVERPLSGSRGCLPGLPRPAVSRDLRHLRLPHEAARRDPAGSWWLHESLQRVPVSAGTRDPVLAHGPTRRERHGDRTVPGIAPASIECEIRGPAHESLPLAHGEVSAQGSGRGVLLRYPRRARGGPGVHPRRQLVVTSRQRWRCEESLFFLMIRRPP